MQARPPLQERRAESTMGFNRRFDRLIFSTRVAVIVGFGGLLAIITLSGVNTLRVMQEIRRNDDQIRQEFLLRNHILNNIRSDLYLSGTYVRDYLLDPEPGRAESHLAALKQVRTEMDSALDSYANRLDAGETRNYSALKIELARYWDILEPVLQLDARERQNKGFSFVRDEVFPRRAAMLGIANNIADLNEQQLSAGNERDAALLSSFQRQLAVTLLITVLLGI